jgi:Ni/Co efflux regulator RcnB
LDSGLKEPEVEATVPRIEMTDDAKQAKLAELREMMGDAHEKPVVDVSVSTDTRSRSDIAMGIWRNDQGGVISKFAWEKLQRLKEHARENNFVIDDYSQ